MIQRIITGLILGLIVLASVFVAPPLVFALLAGVFVSLAAVEWASICQLKRGYSSILFVIIVWLAASLFWQYWLLVAMIAALFWAVLCCAVIFWRQRLKRLLQLQWVLQVLGVLLLAMSWVLIVHLQILSPALLFYLILVVSLGDTAGYFIGSRWGKRPLAPSISPKKTREGFAGQLVIGSVGGLIMVPLMPLEPPVNYGFWLLLGICLIAISVFGDLFESMIKRTNDIKDSGTILPGHGGVLDRIDSLVAVLPIYVVILHFMFSF